MATYMAVYCQSCIPEYNFHMWFYFENSSTYTISADFTSVTPQLSFSAYELVNSITNSNSSFTNIVDSSYTGQLLVIPPGYTLAFRGPTVDNGPLQIGSAPILSINGSYVNFWFWNTESYLNITQYINLIANDGFTTQINTSTQNTIIGNGSMVSLGGCGGGLSTNNICVQITDYFPPPSGSIELFSTTPPSSPVPEPSVFGVLFLAAALAVWRKRQAT